VAEEAYNASDYQFPEAYVGGEESNVYLIPNLEKGTYRLSGEKPREGIALGKTVYEEAGEKAIDHVEGKTRKWLAIILPWEGRKAILVPPDTPIIVYEVGGAQTVFTSREGDHVRPGKVMGYVLTGKGETRTKRYSDEALVLYIAWDRESHPPRYRVILVDPGNARILEPETE